MRGNTVTIMRDGKPVNIGETVNYKSFPEYDWLNDLLHSGKSGTMFLSRANESAGQLTKDGSLTLTR